MSKKILFELSFCNLYPKVLINYLRSSILATGD